MSKVDQLYQLLPARLQNIAINAYGSRLNKQRFGQEYARIAETLAQNEFFDVDKLRGIQEHALSKIINEAKRNVPFYRRLFTNKTIQDKDAWKLDDLADFPVIDKEIIRSSGDDFLNETFPKKSLVHGHTSGTTGSPLNLWYSRENVIFTAAVDWRQKSWGGVTRSDVGAILLGRTIVNPNRSSPPFGQYIKDLNQLWLSSFHLSDKYADWFHKSIVDRKVTYIEGYPSTLFELAQLFEAIGIQLNLKAAFSSSETLHDSQREQIEKVFGCKLFDFYGLAERVAFATECGNGNCKHLNPEYAVNEVVDESGLAVPDGEPGYLVGTALTNLGMPLIRYRTSDKVSMISGICECGRSMARMSNVVTKDEDVVRLGNGRVISPSVLTHPFKPHDSIAKSQIIQTEPNRLLIKLVMTNGDEFPAVTEQLRSALQARLGEALEVEFERVEDIAKSANGKYRWVISLVEG